MKQSCCFLVEVLVWVIAVLTATLPIGRQISVSHDSLFPVQLQEEEMEAPSPAGTKFNIPKTLRYSHSLTPLSLGRCSREVLSLFGSGGR